MAAECPDEALFVDNLNIYVESCIAALRDFSKRGYGFYACGMQFVTINCHAGPKVTSPHLDIRISSILRAKVTSLSMNVSSMALRSDLNIL